MKPYKKLRIYRKLKAAHKRFERMLQGDLPVKVKSYIESAQDSIAMAIREYEKEYENLG